MTSKNCFPTLVLAALLFPLVGVAEAQPDEWVVVEDAAGDVYQPQGAETAAPGMVDIREVRVRLTGELFSFEIEVADVDKHPSATPFASAEAWLEFRARGESYRASVVLDYVEGVGFDLTSLEVFKLQGNYWGPVAEFEAFVDRDANVLGAELGFEDLGLLLDGVPGPGEQIDLVGAGADYNPLGDRPHGPSGFPGERTYAFHDSLQIDPEITLQVPGVEREDLTLSTPRPIRFSNGEATTYHWPITVSNQGSEPFAGELEVNVPSQLSARHPAAFSVQPGESRVVDVFVTTPFNHVHGGREDVVVEFHSVDGVERIELGIEYLAVPQPAGHHDTVYLHGTTDFTTPETAHWMNTLRDDSEADTEGNRAYFVTCIVDGTELEGLGWNSLLKPGLRIGVDARVNEFALLRGTLDRHYATPEGIMVASLALYSASEAQEFVTSANRVGSHDAQVAVPGSTGPDAVALELQVPLPRELDWLPPQGDRNLALRVAYCPTSLEASTALSNAWQMAGNVQELLSLQPETSLQLPLDEYREGVDLDAEGQPLELSVPDVVIRAAPGASVLWTVSVSGEPGRYDASVFGVDESIAVLHAGAVAVGEDGAVLPVSVEVPDDALDGRLLEFVLELSQDDRPSVLGLGVLVDTSSPRDDSEEIAALAASDEAAPGAPLALVLALLAGLVMRRQPRLA